MIQSTQGEEAEISNVNKVILMAILCLRVRKMCQEEKRSPWMGVTRLPFSVQEGL